MTTPDHLLVAGFDPDCTACHRAVRERGWEACVEHYVPTHTRPRQADQDPDRCPGCGGRKSADAERCGRCRAAA